MLKFLKTGVWLAASLMFATGVAGSAYAEGQEKARFVLVHGAWHVGDAWSGVIRRLKELGYGAEAITLAGHGKAADRKNATFADSEKILLDALAKQDRPVILVGHSAAGVLLEEAAGKANDKLAGVVFHDAFIVPDGTSLFDSLPPEIRAAFKAAAAASPDNSLPVDEGFWRNVLLGGVPEDKASEIIAQMVPQPFNYYTHKVDASSFANVTAPKFVLLATEDKSLPPGAWQGMASLIGKSTTVDIHGGHEVLLTDPDAVADGLVKIAELVEKK